MLVPGSIFRTWRHDLYIYVPCGGGSVLSRFIYVPGLSGSRRNSRCVRFGYRRRPKTPLAFAWEIKEGDVSLVASGLVI